MSYTYPLAPTTVGPTTEETSTPPRVEQHGVVYTKPWVVELILDLAGYAADADLGAALAVEPAAGEGSFLVALVRRLLASCRRWRRSPAECGSAILAYELDPVAAERARRAVVGVLLAEAMAGDEAERLARSWVRTGDYLLDAPTLPQADFVVGNPPYIRLEAMDEATAARYRRTYRTMVGRADLYIPFFEAALKQLKPGGVCAYICADRWMRNQYGAELRRLVTAAYSVETVIEMHRADAFESEVSAYPAVTVIRRGDQGPALVASLRSAAALPDLSRLTAPVGGAPARPATAGAGGGPRVARVESWFRGADPWPCVSPARLALLKYLEAEFYPLESVGTATRVGIGVATGADDIFITADPDLVEPSRLLPLALAADTATGRLCWSGHHLVNPWGERGLVELAKFPRLRSYFAAHEARLRGRHVGQRNPHAWHRTIDRVNGPLLGRPKLYIADIKDRLNPVLDAGATYPHHNLYFVQSAAWDHEVLGGLLLSAIGQFFVECYGVRMRGGYLRFQAQYLRRIRVPRPHDLSPGQEEALRRAFRARDRAAATAVALAIYRIDGVPGEDD